MQATLTALALLLAPTGPESGRTYYTPERVAQARENVARFDWAKAVQARILDTGDKIEYYIGPTYTAARRYADQSDDFLWLLQPTTRLPRVYDFNEAERAVCPVHGEAVREVNVWCPWRIDPIEHPYQVQCPIGKEWYPSNRYHEGDLTSGDYPDDGNGCVVNGKRYYFLREYVHMVYGSVMVPTLTSLSQAYLLTGEARYAHKGCVLLARLATEYPNYGWEGTSFTQLENRFDRSYLGPWDNWHPYYKWKQGGMVTDLIWSTFMAEATAIAYDAFRDHMDRDPELIAFLRAKGMPIANGADLRRYIEDYILRADAVGLLRGHIRGNEGHHQAAALAIALVLDDYSDQHPNSKDLVEDAYHGAGHSRHLLVNGLTRDGGGHESPNYSRIKFDMIRVAQRMEEIRRRQPGLFPAERYPDIFAHPKARRLFDHYIDVLAADEFLPPIGDSGGLRAPRRVLGDGPRHAFMNSEYLFAFDRYRDPRFARAATAPDGTLPPGDLWSPYPADALQAALKEPASRIERGTRALDGYGAAYLESGEWPRKRSVVLNYSSIIGHRQQDQLALWLYARGVELLPDLGYPQTWDHRWEWDSNSLAHNTVTVNERPFTTPRFFRNGARVLATGGGVHLANAFHSPYVESVPLGKERDLPCDRYERTVLLVDVDEDRFYVVDLFHVNGGEQHDQSWHGMRVPPEVPALDWQAQEKGTLAGPEVAEFAAYTDRFGASRPKGFFPSFVTSVRRARLHAPAVWTWRSGLPEGDALSLHVVPLDGAPEVIMGRGRSPVWPEKDRLDYLLVRRQVQDGGTSRYLTILDAYQNEPVVRNVRVVSQEPLVIEVTRPDGSDTIHLHVADGPSRTTAHRPIGARVVSRQGNRVTRDTQIGTWAPGEGPGYAQSQVAALDYAARTITVAATPGASEAFAPGRTVRVFNEHRTGLFRVERQEPVGNQLRLTLADSALVAQFEVNEARDGRLILAETGPFVTGHVDPERDGALIDGAHDFYYGCRLGEGIAVPRVQGIANANPPTLHLMPSPAEAGPLPAAGEVVSLWQYGLGDTVEAPRLALQPAP